MFRSPYKFYLSCGIACSAGFLWIFLHCLNSFPNILHGIRICWFRQLTSLPCPSCGSTHAILLLLKGDWVNGFIYNPFGIIIFIVMIISPLWMGYDIIRRKNSFFLFFSKTEVVLQQKLVAIPLILLTMGNWIWNIYKGN